MAFPFLPNYASNQKNQNKLENYDYKFHLPKFHKPKKKGHIFNDLYTIQDNLTRGLSIAVTGREKCNKKDDMRIGERTFFVSGTCGPTSTPDCVDKKRFIPIDTIPSGDFNKKNEYDNPNAPKLGKHSGLIPGILEDIFSINPGELVKAFAGTSEIVNDKCKSISFVEKQMRPMKSPLIATQRLCVPYKSTSLNNNMNSPNIKEDFEGGEKKYRNFLAILFVFISLIFFISYFTYSFLR